MTLDEFLIALSQLPSDAPLIFELGQTRIGSGYHITELRLARVEAIDCAAQRANWSSATLQLLDGQDGAYMAVGKAARIIAQSVSAIPGLGAVEAQIEFSPGNRGLGIYGLDMPELQGDTAIARLLPLSATCRPSERAKTDSRCNVPADAQTACCA